jgi:outer membrane protein OmpA-like peptidoglycan-associated protein
MKQRISYFPLFALILALVFSAATLPAQQADAKDCKDHPLFTTRMPEYRIGACKVEAFGVYEFFVTKGPKIPVEGKFTFITYNFTGQRANEPSGLAVIRNYENAIRKAGGTILQSDPQRWLNGKIVKDGREVWVQAEKGNGTVWLRIVEKEAMEQFIVADAAAMGKDIHTSGHVAVYGIYFDTGKATIKAESAAAIAEIAKLLKTTPALKLFVVGHTDNEGTVEGNITLSQARGEAVLQALVREHGIGAARLRSFGCGQFAPVAANDGPEGRARNRRVELVKQ